MGGCVVQQGQGTGEAVAKTQATVDRESLFLVPCCARKAVPWSATNNLSTGACSFQDPNGRWAHAKVINSILASALVSVPNLFSVNVISLFLNVIFLVGNSKCAFRITILKLFLKF